MTANEAFGWGFFFGAVAVAGFAFFVYRVEKQRVIAWLPSEIDRVVEQTIYSVPPDQQATLAVVLPPTAAALSRVLVQELERVLP